MISNFRYHRALWAATGLLALAAFKTRPLGVLLLPALYVDADVNPQALWLSGIDRTRHG